MRIAPSRPPSAQREEGHGKRENGRASRARAPPPVLYFPRGIDLLRNSSRRRNRADGTAPLLCRARQMPLPLSSPDCPALFSNPKGIHETVLAAPACRPSISTSPPPPSPVPSTRGRGDRDRVTQVDAPAPCQSPCQPEPGGWIHGAFHTTWRIKYSAIPVYPYTPILLARSRSCAFILDISK